MLALYRFDKGIEGGESMFADMFHIAETFREKYPEDFQVLATVPATLDTIHYKRSVCYCVRMTGMKRYCCGFKWYCSAIVLRWYCYRVKWYCTAIVLRWYCYRVKVVLLSC